MKKILSLTFALFIAISISYSQSSSEYIQMGIKLHDSGNYKSAIKQYKKALKINKNAHSANYEIAYTYSIIKDHKKAIKYASKVINVNPQPSIAQQAYDIKGTAQDELGKPYEAIVTYEEGIKYYPNFYLLHFNLGLTQYKTYQFKKAETSFINAIKVKPDHTTSHLLLGFAMDEQGKRVQALMSFYYFLMLESKSGRSELALKSIMALMSKGVESNSDGTNIQINVASLDTEDPFSTIDMLLSISQAVNSIDIKDIEITEGDKFYKSTKSMFEALAEEKDKNTGFWWEFYVSYFDKCLNSEHLEAYCYYISQKSEEPVFSKWVKANPEKVKAYKKWRLENKITK